MTKDYFLTAYADIENRYSIRAEKIKQIDKLLSQLKTEKTVFSLEEIVVISTKLLLDKTVIRQPVFAAVIYPILSKGVEEESIEAVKTLIKLAYPLQHYQNYTKHYQHSTRSLVTIGLKLAPNDLELLDIHEKDIRDYLHYTLHELPTGVLYDMDSSDIKGCDELLQLLADYEHTCQKLGVNHYELINECRFYYVSYKNYLTGRFLDVHLYKDFSDYLTKNGEYSGQS